MARQLMLMVVAAVAAAAVVATKLYKCSSTLEDVVWEAHTLDCLHRRKLATRTSTHTHSLPAWSKSACLQRLLH